MNKPIKLLILFVLFFFAAGVSLACDECDGVRSAGFWTNHDWYEEVGEPEICFGPWDDKICFDYIPKGGKDKCDTMLRQILAARLNKEMGCESECIRIELKKAQWWYYTNCDDGQSVHAGGPESPWRYGEKLYRKLDAYNNGRLCAPKGKLDFVR